MTTWDPLPPVSPDLAERRSTFIDIEIFGSIFARNGEIGNLTVVGDLTLSGADFATNTSGNRRLRIREELDGDLEWFDAGDNQIAGIHVESVGDTLDISSEEGILIDASKDGATALDLKASGTLSDVDITATNDVNVVAVTDVTLDAGNSILADRIYINTGGTANVVVASNGALTRDTSAAKYKRHIDYQVDYLADIELRPTKHWRPDEQGWRYSLIADDLADQDPMLGEYNQGGEIESYDFKAVIAILSAKVNRLEARALI